MKNGDFFPTRWTLVAKNGSSKQVSKSRSFEYILRRKDELRSQYNPDEIEFIIKRSEVKKCRKPNDFFDNLPEWEVFHWGVNSDGAYYVADEDLNKIKKLT